MSHTLISLWACLPGGMLGEVGCNFRGVGLLAEADGHAFAAVEPDELGLFGALEEWLGKVGCNA